VRHSLPSGTHGVATGAPRLVFNRHLGAALFSSLHRPATRCGPHAIVLSVFNLRPVPDRAGERCQICQARSARMHQARFHFQFWCEKVRAASLGKIVKRPHSPRLCR